MKPTPLTAIFFAAGLTALVGCKKYRDNDPLPPVSPTPKIELVSVAPLTLVQLQDSVVFTIRYTDGDGDLGFANPDSMSVELTDLRFPLTFRYHLQPLAPTGASLTITGLLPVVLHNIILENAGGAEQATFAVRLRDRAGRWSNKVVTPAVTVTP